MTTIMIIRLSIFNNFENAIFLKFTFLKIYCTLINNPKKSKTVTVIKF